MPRRTDRPLHRFHIRLFEEDVKYLSQLHGDGYGITDVIRNIVHTYVQVERAKAAKEIDALPPLEFSEDDFADLDATP